RKFFNGSSLRMEQRRLRHPPPSRQPDPASLEGRAEPAQEGGPGTPPRGRRSWLRAVAWIGAGLATLLLVLVIAAFFIDEPLRAYLERELNQAVTGYTFRIEKLDFHPFGLGLDLEGVTVTQDSQPSPPVAKLDRWSASLEWKALLS